MKPLALFNALRRHRKLAGKRAVNFEQNKTARGMVYIAGSLMIVYLVFIAIMFALIANESSEVTALELMFGLAPFILPIDFGVRFMAQQTPAQLIKPYVLLPISRYACIDTFIATSLWNSGYLIWLALFLPYCLMAVVFSYGVWCTVGFLLMWWLLIMLDSQWYSIVRTLIVDSQLWWLLPIAVYALLATPIFLGQHAGIEKLMELWSGIGTAIEHGSALPFLVVFLLLAGVVAINRQLQYKHIWRELAHVETTKLRSVSKFAFLDKYGIQGEYLKLEMKSILRNKNPRKSFISAFMIVLLFSVLIVFTDVYDGQFMTNFWCIYDYVVFGSVLLIKIMSTEGNYIDGLMVHKENILSLFHAKYSFYSVMLLFPFMLMLPVVFSGKWSLLMVFSYGVFTAGFQYFVLFQMAVYNKQTIPLNTKFISKSGIENNYFQIAAQMVAFIVPVALVSVLQSVVSLNTSYIIMLAVGLLFIATNRLWLRNIYTRMMVRRYDNMESFRASR